MLKKSKEKKVSKKKQAPEKKHDRQIYVLGGLLVVLFLLISGIYWQSLPTKLKPTYSKKISYQRGILDTAHAATSSATPAPTPKSEATYPAHQIPHNFGRSVFVPILYYHYIGNNPNPTDKARDSLSITPDKFEAEMKYLSENGYNTVTPDTLYAALKGGLLPPKPVLLTFDDGYIDFYLNAYPILRRFSLHATVFIPTGLMNQGYYLNWNQIKEMDASGLISIGAHSVSHVNLAALSGDKLKYQIFESKKVLESQLGHPVNFFAYPYGTSSPEAWRVVKEVGFLAAFGTWTSKIQSEGTIFDLPRERMGGNVDLATFATKL